MDERKLLQLAIPPILGWYSHNRRDLPWRKGRTPYSVLVSELMLQQTRVEAVKERYVLFMKKFPTAEALATADEEEVLKMWEGLGYYSRARNLHKAAKIIKEEGFPQTWVGVRSLPGVGDYTAGAICSIALGLPAPAVDGNVLRILTRLFADPSNIDEIAVKKRFGELLKSVFPPQTADFTESLMELGATVCVPNGAPVCGACPWSTLCTAHLEGKEEQFPVHGEKRARKIVEATVVVMKCGDRYAVVKREEKGLLAGLYGFPFYESPVRPESFGRVLKSKKAKHIFTHIEWHMTGFLVETDAPSEQFIWATGEEIFSRYAIPSAFRAFLGWVEETPQS